MNHTLHQWAGPLCILPLVAFEGARGKSTRAAVQPTSRSEDVTVSDGQCIVLPRLSVRTFEAYPSPFIFHFAYATRQL
jgi:hypothetical protein